MQLKDVAFIKIVQFISKKKIVTMGGDEGIYVYFDMITDKKGNYQNNGKWPFSARSLFRYVEELCEIGIIKSVEDGTEKFYSINEEKYIQGFEYNKEAINTLLKLLIENKELKLFNKINNFSYDQNKKDYKYDDEMIDKLLKRVKSSYKESIVNKDLEDKIKIAICESRKITVKYKQKIYTVSPLAIVRNNDNTKYYLLYLRKNNIGQPFDMDNVQEVTLLEKENIDKSIYIHKIRKRWGIDGGAEISVRILFFNNKDVIKSVKNDLSNRIGYELKKVDEGYVYTDNIDGINDFKRWLRAYANNCIVLEPKFLADEIISGAKEKLKRYGVHKYEM